MLDVIYPRVVLAALLEQHNQLRRLASECARIANELDDGRPVAGELTAAIGRLRTAFEGHNRYEEGVLRPVLIAAGASGPLNLERSIEEHVEEHRDLHAAIVDASIGGLREVLRELERHLVAEERYFATLHGVPDAGTTLSQSAEA